MQADSDVIARAKAKEREVLDLYEKTRIKADITVAIPTSDADVKLRLRQMGQPICLFGEDPFSRRERLKLLIGKSGDGKSEPGPASTGPAATTTKVTQTFYTHGSASLLTVRREIAETAIERANARLTLEKERVRQYQSPDTSDVTSYWGSPSIVSFSQIGDSRPLSAIAFAPQEALLAVAGWSGDVNIFDTSSRSLPQLHSLRGHTDRCTSVAWNRTDNPSIHLASGGVDKTIHLWSFDEENRNTSTNIVAPIDRLEGHELRVNRVGFHPFCANLVASTSNDETWRLWDISRKEEILLQEGHIAPVFGIAFHPDGSLVGTSDTAGVVRVWDLRSGRSIMGFEGQHVEQVVGLDFSPNGFHLASCSGDNTVRIWDLRRKRNVDILTAHEKLMSAVKFDSNRGDVLMTAGYDCVARVWRTSDRHVVKNLPIHESRIMAADLSPDGTAVATACYDRTFKVWRQDFPGDVKMKAEAAVQ